MEPLRPDPDEPMTVPLRRLNARPVGDVPPEVPTPLPAAIDPPPATDAPAVTQQLRRKAADPAPPEAPPPPEPPAARVHAVESLFLEAAVRACKVPAPRDVAVAAPPTPAAACPRCGANLIDPGGMGLCSRCGYCESLERDRVWVEAREPSPGQELLRALAHAPAWAFVLVLGSVAVVLASVAVNHALPAGGYERALWGTTQLGVGLLVLLSAQAWLLFKTAPSDVQLTALDALVISRRLWGAALRRMPDTRWAVYLGVWGLTAVVSAAAIIGGLVYWVDGR